MGICWPTYRNFLAVILFGFSISSTCAATEVPFANLQLENLQKDQQIYDFQTANLYTDSDGAVVGAKFWHVPSGTPIFVLEIETVPQVYMWVDTPVSSDRGLPHALEHLLAEKGVKGRYFTLLRDMRLSQSAAATWRDFNFYSFSSGSGMDGFFELSRAWLNALYFPDFSDAEAEREFYHFGISTDRATRTNTITEGGTVYNEMLTNQGDESCYHHLRRLVLGKTNPLASDIGGAPDAMRSVTPDEIRRFHSEYYHLGPNTGFIFVINPKEHLASFLRRISNQLKPIKKGPRRSLSTARSDEFKYPAHSSDDKSPKVCMVPEMNEAAPGQVWLAWRPRKIRSMLHLNLLRLFFSALADGERSVLYKAIVDSKTRAMDLAATNVALDPAPSDSPQFLVWTINVSGVPGTHISVDSIGRLRSLILSRIREIAEYPDHSEALLSFNNTVSSYAQARRRSNRVWMRNSPLFGTQLDAKWKDFLNYLEMDPTFKRSLSQEELWREIDAELSSGKNIWSKLIDEYDLVGLPYILGTRPSPARVHKLEAEKQERIRSKVRALQKHYRSNSPAKALARFDQDERLKTREINQIESRVEKPRFTEHPPLTADDEIHYAQFQINGVPSIAAFFERPPTIELGLSFDLHHIPRKYYKYLPILARCFDATGIKEHDHIVPYTELLNESRARFVEFAAGTVDNPVSHRADFTFRTAVTTTPEFQDALRWIQRVLLSSYVDITNLDRLRDIVADRLALDASYTKQNEFFWVYTPAQAFRYQNDPLYLALEAQFTKAHWDSRLYWRLHVPVSESEIEGLEVFATHTLAGATGLSRSELDRHLNRLHATGIDGELIGYWRRSLDQYAEDRLIDGLRDLAREVEEDLRTGPARTVKDLQELQRLVINRKRLHLDLLISQPDLDTLRPELITFIESIPDFTIQSEEPDTSEYNSHPITDRLAKHNRLEKHSFPWYLSLVASDEVTANAIFYSDSIKYTDLSRDSLVQFLASGLLAGRGPQSLYMKSREAGFAYNLLMRADPARGQLGYYADKISNLPGLLSDMISQADQLSKLRDPYLVDYAFRQSFSVPRSIYSFSIRERVLAQEIRDGNTPEKARRFNSALLKLRNEPHLLEEMTHTAHLALCGILLEDSCKARQSDLHSLFFFVSSERALSSAENHPPIPTLLRVWPSDYWFE